MGHGKAEAIFPDRLWEALRAYLELEAILNRFFAGFDFCRSHCIRAQQALGEPVIGCCTDRYYCKYDTDHPGFALLRQQRERIYGSPAAVRPPHPLSPCEYHRPDGCLLDTHKSPVCLGFFCKEGIDYLRERYHIHGYDYLGIANGLEWVLTGALTGAGLESFRTDCLALAHARF